MLTTLCFIISPSITVSQSVPKPFRNVSSKKKTRFLGGPYKEMENFYLILENERYFFRIYAFRNFNDVPVFILEYGFI